MLSTCLPPEPEPGAGAGKFLKAFLLPWVPPLGKSPATRLAAGGGTEGPLSVDPARVWGAGEETTLYPPLLGMRRPPPLGAHRGQGGEEGHDHPTEASRAAQGASQGLSGASCGGAFLSDARRGPSKAFDPHSAVLCHYTPRGPSGALYGALRAILCMTVYVGNRGVVTPALAPGERGQPGPAQTRAS